MGKPSHIYGRLMVRFDATSETPVMIHVQSRGRHVDSGTYWRVLQEGFDSIDLTDGEQQWLTDIEPLVDAFMDIVEGARAIKEGR